MIKRRPLAQAYQGQSLEHVIVHDGSGRVLPTVIIFPTVMGVSPLELGFAERLAGLGYHSVVADLYGRRFTSDERSQAMEAMESLKADREALRDRLIAVVDEVRKRDHVGRLAVIGYCFGGLCALDVARTGADVAGAASFHGLLDPPGWSTQPIKAKLLVMHGWDDPLAKPDSVVALGAELTTAGADWQVHAYGHTGHGFTNPGARGQTPGIAFNETAARRSWASLQAFLAEVMT
jgi:dienelactone hydrolase